MGKEKVEEPFVKMYELKGLKSNEASFICKVWSFQANGKTCFMSNAAWAEYLGCSPETVKRIKRNLKKRRFIETDRVFVRLLVNMNVLIDILKKNYQPKYKSKERVPYWEKAEIKEAKLNTGQNDTIQGQFNSVTGQTNQSTFQEDSEMGLKTLKEGQIDHQLDKILDRNIKKNEDRNIMNPVLWDLASFEFIETTSIEELDLLWNQSIQRNYVLSYWYNYISSIELKSSSVNLFNNGNYFNILRRILIKAENNHFNSDFLKEIDINDFLMFIKLMYQSFFDEIDDGSQPLDREVADDVEMHIIDHGNNFKYFLTPEKI